MLLWQPTGKNFIALRCSSIFLTIFIFRLPVLLICSGRWRIFVSIVVWNFRTWPRPFSILGLTTLTACRKFKNTVWLTLFFSLLGNNAFFLVRYFWTGKQRFFFAIGVIGLGNLLLATIKRTGINEWWSFNTILHFRVVFYIFVIGCDHLPRLTFFSRGYF